MCSHCVRTELRCVVSIHSKFVIHFKLGFYSALTNNLWKSVRYTNRSVSIGWYVTKADFPSKKLWDAPELIKQMSFLWFPSPAAIFETEFILVIRSKGACGDVELRIRWSCLVQYLGSFGCSAFVVLELKVAPSMIWCLYCVWYKVSALVS